MFSFFYGKQTPPAPTRFNQCDLLKPFLPLIDALRLEVSALEKASKTEFKPHIKLLTDMKHKILSDLLSVIDEQENVFNELPEETNEVEAVEDFIDQLDQALNTISDERWSLLSLHRGTSLYDLKVGGIGNCAAGPLAGVLLGGPITLPAIGLGVGVGAAIVALGPYLTNLSTKDRQTHSTSIMLNLVDAIIQAKEKIRLQMEPAITPSSP